MICYHHNDLDGKCAAAIVLKKFPECRLREIDYKDDPDFHVEVVQDEEVVIVDFSFKPEKMQELFRITVPAFVVWIDHHKTAKDYCYLPDGCMTELRGRRDFSEPGKSGCELTWEYFFPKEEMPEAVRLLGDYDTWRFDTEEKTKLFQMGMRLRGLDLNMPASYRCLLETKDQQRYIDEILIDGGTAIRYRDQFCSNYRNSFGYETRFEGYNCYAMNLATVGSLGFSTAMDTFDICISYVHTDTGWTVSLYSQTVDVSEIAKKYGGGGHSGAAGFICKELPWT
jgi:oligoribonuclease NrnB/cAMP/cGMP phosphodiesterase (DHH superfamily)